MYESKKVIKREREVDRFLLVTRWNSIMHKLHQVPSMLNNSIPLGGKRELSSSSSCYYCIGTYKEKVCGRKEKNGWSNCHCAMVQALLE